MIFVLLSVVALWLSEWLRSGKYDLQSARLSLLRMVLVLGTVLVVLTEVLSLFSAMNSRAVTRSWAVVALVALVVLALIVARKFYVYGRGLWPEVLERLARWPGSLLQYVRSGRTILFWIFLSGFLGVLFVIALVGSPANHDALSYHLPRVMHWADNQTVAFFPTENVRQNDRAPFAEWVLLHVFLLSGDDRLFNLLQWLALVGSCVAVYELTGVFTKSRGAARFAVVLAVTTPVVILEATTSQNDLVAAFFFLCFLVFAFRLLSGGLMARSPWKEGVFCGLAMGLGLLTKSIILLYGGVFGLWFAFLLVRARSWRVILPGVLGVLLSGLIISGHSVRNWRTFGHPLGPRAESADRQTLAVTPNAYVLPLMNEKISPRLFLSNLLRNSVMHFQTGVPNLNEYVVFVEDVHEWLGLKMNEPSITWGGAHLDPLPVIHHEDYSGNLPQVLVFLSAFAFLTFNRRHLSPAAFGYAGCVVLVVILFNLVFRWQAWHARLELPIFLALCPFAAAVLPVTSGGWLPSMIAGICGMYALPFLIDNSSHPLFGNKSIFVRSRAEQYFFGLDVTSGDYAAFSEVVTQIKNRAYRTVGLQGEINDVQYPLWPLLRKATKRNVGFDEVNVLNCTRTFASSAPPEAVLVTYKMADDHLAVGGRNYRRVWSRESLSLFESE